MAGQFRFSFGPWNIHEGADPFGPMVRKSVPFNRKLAQYKKLGFGAVQFHDDDAVPNLNDLSAMQIERRAKAVTQSLKSHGLQAEICAPRLWEDPRTVDGAYTSNNASHRRYAVNRTKKCLDIAAALECDLTVLWLAREGTYIREAKCAVTAHRRLLDAVNMMLDYAPMMRIAIEPKPNEPMDMAYIPSAGHALALGQASSDPSRCGVLIESAHSILANLDPSDDMAFVMALGKLMSVHLNDQNGPKYDQDKAFGSANLRRAFNQVRVLDQNDYGRNGEWVGLDVKAMRTTKQNGQTRHLVNSHKMFLRLLDISRNLSDRKIKGMVDARDYEALDLYIMEGLTGKKR
jgi:xylose isomerase